MGRSRFELLEGLLGPVIPSNLQRHVDLLHRVVSEAVVNGRQACFEL